jgi:hypothetical protein
MKPLLQRPSDASTLATLCSHPFMFRWHSTVIEPSRGGGTSLGTSSGAFSPPKAEAAPTMDEKVIREAFARINMVGEVAERKPDGTLAKPSAFLKTVEEKAGVRFGPQGGGTLLAIVDRRRPTMDEVRMCVLMPGSAIVGLPQPMARSGRGLGHLMQSSTDGRGGRGGQPPPMAGRGGGRGALGLGGRGVRHSSSGLNAPPAAMEIREKFVAGPRR